jgi:hypothetical protein
MQAHPLAKHSLDSISDDRVSHFLRHRKSETSGQHGITSFSRNRQNMAAVELLPLGLDHHELWPSPESHLLRDAWHLLLGSGHRDALATLCTAAAKHFAASTGLLTGAEAVRALTALIVWLVGTLRHSLLRSERDRYSCTYTESRLRSGCCTCSGFVVGKATVPEFTWLRFRLAE